jgi:3-hydroxybutyryl-CoA dehydrogenase
VNDASEEAYVRVAVIGGGTMGVGIAHKFAAAGDEVAMVDIDLATATGAVERVASTLYEAEARGKLGRDAAEQAVANVFPVASIQDLPDGLDLIVEAVIEDVGLKHRILGEAEQRASTILASNTSSISIDALATVLTRPESFVGMHFFNPVWAMPLVEVIRGTRTSDTTLERVAGIVAHLGMEQAVIKDVAGFATSRLGVLVGIEAIRMVEEGVGSPVDIDTAMRLGYRHPMGPLMLGDLVGLDVRLQIADHLASVYGARFQPPDLLRSMVGRGDVGKKSGRGFYDWSSGSAVPIEEG